MGESGGVRKIFRTERISILLGAVVGVVACAEVQVGAHAVKSSSTLSDPAGETALAPVQVATDAEGYALWSGFRTRDGAWIAHPMLPAPSRAYVRNPINGRVIEADLLRRDPTTPGPMILLSAEAARALEIGPHRLTKVQIEVIEDTIPDSALAVAATAEVPSPAPTAAVSEDALAPIETAEASPTTADAAVTSDGATQVLAEIPAEAASEASPTEAPEAPTTQPAAAPDGPAPAPRVLAEIPAEPAPARPAPIAEVSAPSAPQRTTAAPESPQTSAQPSSGVFRGDAPYELGGANGGGDLAAAPAQPAPALSAPAAPAPAAQPAPQAQPARVATTPAAPPVAPPVAAASGEQKFVQVVSFTAEGSAAELATRLNALGQPSLTDSALAGETRWHRVLIGPLLGEAETESALQAARELGYGDAFVTVRGSEAPKAAAPKPAAPAQAAERPTPTPAAQPAQDAAKPYVQVGSYKLEDNARAAVQHLKDRGLPSFTSGGPDWHRVLIGPLESAAAIDQALDAARALGHSDAYVTRF